MTTKIHIQQSILTDDIVTYIAGRYHVSTSEILRLFLSQEGIIKSTMPDNHPDITLESNEIAIFRSMGLLPSDVEFN